MPYDEQGVWRDDYSYQSQYGGGPQPAAGTQYGQTRQGPDGAEPVSPEEQRQREFEAATAEANARGPGWGVAAEPGGGYKVVVVDQNLVREASLDAIAPVGGPPELPGAPERINSIGGVPLTLEQQFGQLRDVVPRQQAPLGTRPLAVRGGQSFGRFAPMGETPGAGVPGVPPGSEPAEVDRARIDALLGNVSRATSGLFGLAEGQRQFSAAEAQLAQGLDQGQRQGLALARSGNRRDAGANMAAAQRLGSEQAAQATQAAAGLRAQEEEAQQRIRADAYQKAGELGLNTAALQVHIEELDMNAATNYLNQLFANNRLQMQLDQQETERITQFVQAMALIQADYRRMDMAERNAIRSDLTARYGISEQSRLAFAQLEANGEFDWDKFLLGLGTAALSGSSQVAAYSLTAGKGKGGGGGGSGVIPSMNPAPPGNPYDAPNPYG